MGLLEQIRTHKFRTVKTLVLYLTFVVLALPNALVGPSLLDLQIATNATVKEITYMIPAGTAGFVIGASLCAFVIEWFDAQLVLIVSLLLNVFIVAYIPYNRTLLNICLNEVLAGVLFGFLDAGGNVWLIHLWGKENPPFMQGLHFAFGLGSFFAPLLAAPFLLPNIDESANGTNTSSAVKQYTPEDLKIQYAYFITSGFTLLVAVLFIVVYLLKRSNKEHPSRTEASKQPKVSGQTFKVGLVVSLVAVTMFFYFGLELGFGQLLTTFAVKGNLKLSKETGALMTSVFWGTFTFARCFTIFVVDVVGSQNLILFDLILVVISTLIIVPFGGTYEWSLWVTAALMGTGLSSMFAAFFGFLEEFTKVNSKITSFITVSSAAGSFVVPYLVGRFIESNPEVFPLITLVCSLCMTVIFLFLLCFKRIFWKRNTSPDSLELSTVPNH